MKIVTINRKRDPECIIEKRLRQNMKLINVSKRIKFKPIAQIFYATVVQDMELNANLSNCQIMKYMKIKPKRFTRSDDFAFIDKKIQVYLEFIIIDLSFLFLCFLKYSRIS